MRSASSSIGGVAVERRHRGPPRPRDSRSPRRPASAGSNRSRRAARLIDQAGVELGPGPRGDPVAVRRGLDRQAEPDDRSRVAAGRRARRIAGELGDLERADDAARVGEVDRRGEARAQWRSGGRRGARGRPSLSSCLEARADGRVARERVGIEAACDGAQVQARAAGEDRDAVPAARSARTARACVAKSATLNGSSGSTRSRPWCGTRARSAAVDLGRADVEAAEDLARIGRDDRHGPAARRRPPPEPDRQLGLAGGRGARDDDERRGVGHAPTSAPRSAYGPAWSMRTRTSRPTSASSPASGRACCRGSGPTGGLPSPAVGDGRRRGRGRGAG